MFPIFVSDYYFHCFFVSWVMAVCLMGWMTWSDIITHLVILSLLVLYRKEVFFYFSFSPSSLFIFFFRNQEHTQVDFILDLSHYKYSYPIILFLCLCTNLPVKRNFNPSFRLIKFEPGAFQLWNVT